MNKPSAENVSDFLSKADSNCLKCVRTYQRSSERKKRRFFADEIHVEKILKKAAHLADNSIYILNLTLNNPYDESLILFELRYDETLDTFYVLYLHRKVVTSSLNSERIITKTLN